MYDIMQGMTAQELIENVNAKMRDGWLPVGGLIMIGWYGQNILLQAMMKEDNSWYKSDEKERQKAYNS